MRNFSKNGKIFWQRFSSRFFFHCYCFALLILISSYTWIYYVSILFLFSSLDFCSNTLFFLIFYCTQQPTENLLSLSILCVYFPSFILKIAQKCIYSFILCLIFLLFVVRFKPEILIYQRKTTISLCILFPRKYVFLFFFTVVNDSLEKPT